MIGKAVRRVSVARTAVIAAAVAALAVPVSGLSPASATDGPGPVRLFASPSVSDGDGDCSAASPCSLPDVITAERAARAAMGSSMSSDIVVYLHGGTYRVSTPIELGPQDSGSDGFHVIFRNFPDESPVLSGGVPITNWTEDPREPGVWSASTANVGEDFLQLYARGHDLARAHTEPVEGGRWTVPGTRKRQIRVPASALPAVDPQHLDGVQVRIMYTWRSLRYPVASIGDPVTEQDDNGNSVQYRYIQLGGEIAKWSAETRWDIEPGVPHWNDFVPKEDEEGNLIPPTLDRVTGETVFSGAREFMDANGEWYLDPQTDTVYLKADFDPNTVEMTAPVHEQLLGINSAQSIRFYGLQFAHSAWNTPLTVGNFQRQGGIHMTDMPNGTITYPNGKVMALWYANPAAVRIGHSSDIRFTRNGFRDTGANAVDLDAGTTDVAFKANIFTDIADTGIFVGTAQEPFPAAGEGNVDTTVVDNIFSGMGMTYATDSAITMTYPHGAQIRHNLIEDVHNIGINVGYIFGMGGTVRIDMQNVQVIGNRIDNVCITAIDCGAWHGVGLAYHDDGVPRSRVIRNYISNVTRNTLSNTGANVKALYCDGSCNGWRLTWNEWDLKADGGNVDDGIRINRRAGAGADVIAEPLLAITDPDDLDGQVDGDHKGHIEVRAEAGLETGYGFLPSIDLATDSIGAARGPHPDV